MNRIYNFPYNLAASILFLSLFIQSCRNPFNSLIPLDEAVDLTPGSGKQILPKQLEGQELRIVGGNLITFYKQDGRVRADVRVDEIQPKPTYTNLPVVLEKRSALASLQTLDPTTRQQRIQFKASKGSQLAYVKVFGGGLLGGMKRKSAEVEREEEKTNKNRIVKRSHLVTDEKNSEELILGDFQVLPLEVLALIFDYIEHPYILHCANINYTFYKLITGVEEVGLIGLDFKPTPIFCLGSWLKNTVIDFKQAKFNQLRPETTRTIFFYRLLNEVENLPQPFWKYLQGANIHIIHLGHNNLGNLGIIEFAQCLQDTKVQNINLSSNKINNRVLKELAQKLQGTTVKEVDLSSNKLDSKRMGKFAKELQKTHVKILNLYGNHIDDIGVVKLAKGLQGTKVHTIDLSLNILGVEHAVEFAKNLQGTNIECIFLGENDIKNTWIGDFFKNLQGTCIHTISLYSNQINNSILGEFVQHLQGTLVRDIDLSSNKITSIGIGESAKKLQKTCVETINLFDNELDGMGVVELAKNLQGSKVQILNLSLNKQLGLSNAAEFAESLQKTAIEFIYLRGNNIDDIWIGEFSRNLEGSKVHIIDLAYNKTTCTTRIIDDINKISSEMQQSLIRQYPAITWYF